MSEKPGMEFRNVEDGNENVNRAEESKTEGEKIYFGNEAEDTEYSNSHGKNGSVPPKPSDVRNGELVSLLLAATPPYLYNIPLVPQTFFFSEMLKSFVQAKTERQNLKAAQSHHRRQRKRSWRESTPPKSAERDKPLELTTPRQAEERPPAKKSSSEPLGEKKLSELGNFSVEKLANSSAGAGAAGSSPGSPDVLPPAPPLWYPLLYPPQPPYGIDPLHFFIDLRVSAHFWNRRTGGEAEPPLAVSPRSAFRAPSPRQEEDAAAVAAKYSGKTTRNVHYVISSLKDIYENVERERMRGGRKAGKSGSGDAEEEEERDEREGGKKETDKDLRALIGLELVVDYVKQESDGEEAATPDSETVCVEH